MIVSQQIENKEYFFVFPELFISSQITVQIYANKKENTGKIPNFYAGIHVKSFRNIMRYFR